jgi:hypothetical protein
MVDGSGHINTTGYDVDGNVVDPIAAGSVTTSSTAILTDNMNADLKLQQRVQDRANLLHSVWTNNYLNCELQTLAEVAAVPHQAVNIGVITTQGFNATAQAYAQARSDIAEAQTEMCYSDACGTTNRLSVAEAKAKSWRVQGDLRYDELRVDDANAQRLNDRITMINPGRGGLAAAMSAMQASQAIFASVAAQAEASKGSDDYAKGRILEFAKSNLGTIAKLFASPATPQNASTGMGSPTMYGPEASPTNPYGSGYQYDSGANLFGVDTPVVEVPPMTIEQFYN